MRSSSEKGQGARSKDRNQHRCSSHLAPRKNAIRSAPGPACVACTGGRPEYASRRRVCCHDETPLTNRSDMTAAISILGLRSELHVEEELCRVPPVLQ